jgi:hypothetical protein
MLALMHLGGLLAMIAMAYGPVVGLLGLLNRRDRRESAILGSVLTQFASPDFRGRIAAEVRCALFSRRAVVTVNALSCSRDEIWNAIARLSRSLPSRVQLVIHPTGDPEFPATFTVEIPASQPGCRPPRASVATG